MEKEKKETRGAKKFTIQNVPIKSSSSAVNTLVSTTFTIQNVPIK